mgnify:CR=1 FL=1
MNYNYKNQWLDIYKHLVSAPEYSPRGLKVKEIENYSFDANPYWRFANFTERNLNIRYIIGELCWYLRGDLNDVEGISHYSKFWAGLASESEPRLNSNYGHYIFKEVLKSNGNNQYSHVINSLIADKDTRQAAIIIATHDVLSTAHKDKICTYSMSFRIRDDKLNMSVRMRSNDFVLGTQIDFFQFSVIQELILVTLKNFYPKLEMGTYHHSSDSFHVYEKHYDMMQKIVDTNGESFQDIIFPKISGTNEALYIINNLPRFEKMYRELGFPEKLIEEELASCTTNGYEFTKTCVEFLRK